MVESLKELKLPDGRIALQDIVVKPDNSCFQTDGPDIVINANIVSCKRPEHISIEKTGQDYFEAAGAGDIGSHRRNGIFIGSGAIFPKISSRKTFDHTDFAPLFLTAAGIKNAFESSSIMDYIGLDREAQKWLYG